MADLPIENPLSWLYTQFFNLLVDYKPFASQFKPGNLIRYDDARRKAHKQSQGNSDLPSCTLQPARFIADEVTSSTSKFIVSYQLMLATDDWQIEPVMNVTFEGIIAVMYWKDRINFPGYTQRGYKRPNLVTDVSITDGQQGQAQNISIGERPQVLDGWSSLFQIDVRLHFETRDILPPLNLGN